MWVQKFYKNKKTKNKTNKNKNVFKKTNRYKAQIKEWYKKKNNPHAQQA